MATSDESKPHSLEMPQHIRSITPEFPPPPRKVRRTVASGCALALPRLFVLPHMVLGVMFLLYAPIRLYVEQFGTPVVATVDNREIRTTKRGSQMYLVNYHLTINGKRYDDSRSFSRAAFANLHDGDEVQGRTSPLLYFTVRFQGEHFVGPPAWSDGPLVIPFFVSIAWNAFIGVFFYRYWYIPFRQRRLLRTGSWVTGAVTSIREQKRGRCKVSYSFTTAKGELVFGSQDTEGEIGARAGMPCCVFYNSKKPSCNIAYEYSGLKIFGRSIE